MGTKEELRRNETRTSLAVQWLRLHLPVPGVWVAKIPHGSRQKKKKHQNIKQKPYCKKKLVKDFKNGPDEKKILKRSQMVSSPGFTVENGDVMGIRFIS